MENKLWILLRAQYRNYSGVNAFFYEKDTKKKRRAIGMIVAYLLVSVMLFVYCFGLSYGMGFLGLSDVVPGYALAITGIVTLLFTFIKTNGYLFACKDYDLVMALPIQTRTVITARFLYMYLKNLLFTVGVMIPMGIGFFLWKPISVASGIMWAIGMLAAPLLPMTLAAALGALVTAIGSRFRFKVLVEVVLSIALLLAIFAGSFYLQGMEGHEEIFIAQISDIGTMLSQQMHKIYPLSAWFDSAINNGRIIPFISYLLVSAIWYGIFVLAIGKYYRSINTALTTSRSKSNYQLQGLKTSSLRMALARKEAKRFFSSSIYLLNMGMGLLMALGASVALLICGEQKLMELIGLPVLGERIIYVIPFLMAMMINMSSTTSVSLSLEGKNLWIVKSLPISPRTLFEGKMLFQLMLELPVSLICSIIMMIALRVTAIQALLYALILVTTVLFSTVWGMWINIHFPNYAWDNEVQVIKQGMASMLGVMSNLAIYLILGIFSFVVSGILGGEILLLMIIIGLFAGTAIFYRAVIHATIS